MEGIEIRNGVAHILWPMISLPLENGVAVGMIVVKMRVDHPPHRLVRDQFHIRKQRSRGR